MKCVCQARAQGIPPGLQHISLCVGCKGLRAAGVKSLSSLARSHPAAQLIRPCWVVVGSEGEDWFLQLIPEVYLGRGPNPVSHHTYLTRGGSCPGT